MDFDDDVRAVLEKLDAGVVMTYGEVALESGHPGAARAVGQLLARDGHGLPWWRVVTGSGRLVPGAERAHARLLRSEGVAVADDRVVMRRRTRGGAPPPPGGHTGPVR